MTNPLQKIVNEFDWLRQSPSFIWWDQWIPDESWAAYLSNKEGGLSYAIMHDEFNYAIKQTQPYQTILFDEKQNDIGIYYHKIKVKKRMVSFYYISEDKNHVPVRPKDPDEWSKYFDKNCIIRSTRKRVYEPLQNIQVVMTVPPDDGETVSPSPAELHDRACQLSGSSWKDKKLRSYSTAQMWKLC